MTSYQKLKNHVKWLEKMCDEYYYAINDAKEKVLEPPSIICGSAGAVGTECCPKKLERDPYKLGNIIGNIPLRHQPFCRGKKK